MDGTFEYVIAELQLAPHPEGGFYRRIYESATTLEHAGKRRPALTAIHFLLPHGHVSQWHRVDADECWHWQDGDALELLVFDPETECLTATRLESAARGCAMHVVPAGHWQAARPLGAFALAACTVSPGFVWDGFEMLAPGSDIADALRRHGVLDL